jgi:fructan beta-fructosidase
LEVEVELVPENASEMGFRLRKGAGEETLVAFSSAASEVFVDRSKSGTISFSPDFPGRHKAKVRATAKLRLHIFVDRSSLEVFVNQGEAVLTDRIYPQLSSDGIELYSDGGRGRVVSLSIWKLGAIWQ